jgi:hypothetical protein
VVLQNTVFGLWIVLCIFGKTSRRNRCKCHTWTFLSNMVVVFCVIVVVVWRRNWRAIAFAVRYDFFSKVNNIITIVKFCIVVVSIIVANYKLLLVFEKKIIYPIALDV